MRIFRASAVNRLEARVFCVSKYFEYLCSMNEPLTIGLALFAVFTMGFLLGWLVRSGIAYAERRKQ